MSSRPNIMQDPRPGADAAHADDLAGDVGQAEVLEQVAPIALQRRPVAAQQRRTQSISSSCSMPSTSSSIGWMSGGSLMIRRSPSTTWDSLSRALDAVAGPGLGDVGLRPLAGGRVGLRSDCLSASSTSMWAYHTARFVITAYSRIAVRYAPSRLSSTVLRSLVEYPLSRPAIAKLAASRLTSHSHGPGNVSSKSLRPNTSRRSGEANPPKFIRWASPHSCVVIPERGVPARSLAMISAAPR